MESEPPRRIVAVGDQFRYESGLRDRFRDRDGLRKLSGNSHGRIAISRNPTQGASIADGIAGLERRTVGAFTGPVSVGEPVRMLMRWIAIMDVHERSLGERQQKARRDAEMDRAPHFVRL
jgi:hypothetical protein